MIATGGVPSIEPRIEGQELGITSDQAFHLQARPGRVVIVGSGYIGVEFAGIFAGLGSETGMVYRQKLPLRGFDEDLRVRSTMRWGSVASRAIPAPCCTGPSVIAGHSG